MIIYISLDMEGICGTYNWEQETKDRSSVIYAITKQMEYVVEGIRQSDKNHLISDIIIADSHSSGDNLPWSFSEKDSRISILSGSPRPYYMMPGFSEEIDRVFLIGYHAGTGAYQGNMDHTYSNRRVHRISVNDIPMNEAFLNTAYASCFKVPVVLVSGDACLKQEMLADDKMPWIEFIETKKAVSKFAALNYSAERVKIDTIEKVKNALKKDRAEYPLYHFQKPFSLKITFNSSSFADVAQMIPYSVRLDGRTIEFKADDYQIIFETMMAMITLTYTVNP